MYINVYYVFRFITNCIWTTYHPSLYYPLLVYYILYYTIKKKNAFGFFIQYSAIPCFPEIIIICGNSFILTVRAQPDTDTRP